MIWNKFLLRRRVRLERHAAKGVAQPLGIFSVVAKNQYPGLVTLTHYHDRLGIEIAEINTDVLGVNAGLPRKDSGRLRALRESIVEIPGNDQEAVAPRNHISNTQPTESKSYGIAELSASTFLDYLHGIKQRNEDCVFGFRLWISKSDP